jgi:outer membrane protein assembly factor BamE (lipoprotein component of BamABCDE complex)
MNLIFHCLILSSEKLGNIQKQKRLIFRFLAVKKFMSSPFLIYNIGVLLFVIAAFAIGIYLLFSKKVKTYLSNYPIFLQILFRAFTVIYAAFLSMVLLIAVMFFIDIEVSTDSRECWRRNYEWKNIQVGMTQKQVVQILGEPLRSEDWSGLRYSYKRHPLDYISMADVTFDPNSAPNVEDMKVISKYPDDARMAEDLSVWMPTTRSFVYNTALLRISGISLGFSFLGLIALAIISLVPFSLRDKWTSRMLYVPFATVLFAGIYEHYQVTASAWRFDLFFLYPLYAIISIGWLIRLLIVVKSEKERL